MTTGRLVFVDRILLVAWLLGVICCAGSAAASTTSTTQRGPVTATVEVSPASVPIGDTVELTLMVTGDAGVAITMPNFGESLERFDVLDFAPKESVDENGNLTLSQRYRLYAGTSGAQRIPPMIIEFVDQRPGQRPAPDGEDAFELLTDALTFTVESVAPSEAGDALKPLPAPLPETSIDAPSAATWSVFGAGLLGVGIIAGFLYWRSRQPALRQGSAYEVAMRELEALSRSPRPPEDAPEAMDAFFVTLSGIVRRYLEERFALHAPELTTEEFLDVAVSSPDLTTAHQRFLRDFLRTSDQVKFARAIPESAYLDTALNAVSAFLEQTRQPAGQPAGALNSGTVTRPLPHEVTHEVAREVAGGVNGASTRSDNAATGIEATTRSAQPRGGNS